MAAKGGKSKRFLGRNQADKISGILLVSYVAKEEEKKYSLLGSTFWMWTDKENTKIKIEL